MYINYCSNYQNNVILYWKIASGNIYATAINNAQNKTTAAVGAINVDDYAPVVSFAKSEIITYDSGINGSTARETADRQGTAELPVATLLWVAGISRKISF